MKFSKQLLAHTDKFIASRLRLSVLSCVFLIIQCTSLAAKEDISFFISNSTLLDKNIHQALQQELDDAGLKHIKVTSTDFWHPYAQGIREGRTGLFFAPPHFSAWAIQNHQFKPLLKLSGALQYVLLSRRNDIDIFEVSDLARKRICASKAPNLDFILASSALTRSLNSPLIISKESATNSMLDNDKDCDAFVVGEHLYIQHALKNPYQFVRLQQGKKYQNYAFISSADIDKETRLKFQKIMLSKRLVTLLKPLYSEYSNKPVLLKASNSDYKKTPNDYLNKVWAE